jgi:DNA-binding GntR family transcriptional regulator
MITREAAPLRTQAVEAIRSHIVDETYAPGSRLKEKELCAAYGVSRTVIREALRQLESEHLIRIEPQVGAVVVTLTLAEVRHLYEARAALEASAAKFAARRGDEEQIGRLVDTFDEIVARPVLPMAELIALKNRFYAALVDASGNEILGQMLANVQARISQLRRLTLGSPHRHEQMVQELRSVIRAIQARDEDAAYSACLVHVKSAEAIALASIASRTVDGLDRTRHEA